MADPYQNGRVTAAHGRHYLVTLETTGTNLQCTTRGKRSGPAVGDRVRVVPGSDHAGVITEILPRRNLLFRSDASRSKQFAANIDQLLVVVAGEPTFSDDLLGRALVAASSTGITPIVLLNKTDLPSAKKARERLRTIEALGFQVIATSALDGDQTRALLLPLLQHRTSLLLGQSGMGKSTLLNALIPDALAPTQAHSQALDSGRHTTTHTRLYSLPSGGDLLDSPGFQAFGLQHLSQAEIERGFPEFKDPSTHCRFYNCSHRHEPGCGVLAAVASGAISSERHALYQRILEENEAAHKKR